MHVDVERVVLLEHGHELFRDPLGQDAGYARADADDLDVGDGTDALDDGLEPAVAEHERIAARDDHVPDLRVAADIGQPVLDVQSESLGDLLRFPEGAP